MRQSSSRNHRSRGWKVKPVLQVCVLVAVCIWLLYQVKHSHDKKKALEVGTLKVSDRVEESRPDFLKLGRKDPQVSTVVTTAGNVPHNDEEENEQPEEAAEQENKQEENVEEDVKWGGDDEIDESDQERGDDEAEGGDEFGDEEDKEGRSGNVNLLENGDHEDDEGRSQDAREEQYKADDASSAVVRDTQEIAQENGDGGGGRMDEVQNENVEKSGLESGGRSNGTEVATKDDEMHDLPTDVVDQLHNTISLNGTALGEKEPEVESLQNSTVLLESAEHVEEHNITSSNSSDQLEHHDNATSIFEPQSQNEQQTNSTESISDEQSEAHNVSLHLSLHNNVETDGTTPENGTANFASVEDQSWQNETHTSAEENSMAENTLLEQNQKSNVTEGVEESDKNHNTSSTINEDSDASQGEATDSSSDLSTITEEDREARTDVSTLPDIQIESRKEEDMAAE